MNLRLPNGYQGKMRRVSNEKVVKVDEEDECQEQQQSCASNLI